MYKMRVPKERKCLKVPNRNNRAEEDNNWITNSIEKSNSWLDEVKETISKLKDIAAELIQSEEQK